MSRKAIITGINGFVGNFLANYVTSKGFAIFGIDMAAQPAFSMQEYITMDIRDTEDGIGRLTDIP